MPPHCVYAPIYKDSVLVAPLHFEYKMNCCADFREREQGKELCQSKLNIEMCVANYKHCDYMKSLVTAASNRKQTSTVCSSSAAAPQLSTCLFFPKELLEMYF